MAKINVIGTEISIISVHDEDYISLTDMIKGKDGAFFISDWLRNRNTIEYLGIWESVHNRDFNYGEYATIKRMSGLNRYKISSKEWALKTNAIGIKATPGRYGGTYAHPDIAFEFGMWISPEFKIYLVKEFQRLKKKETELLTKEWNLQRTLAKINYKIHTDAIKAALIPPKVNSKDIERIYADEADLLNIALFGKTAKESKSDGSGHQESLRDKATIEQLVVLSNLESINALFIHQGLTQVDRLTKLNQVAITQMKSLLRNTTIKKLK